jgi:hypothetical protein
MYLSCYVAPLNAPRREGWHWRVRIVCQMLKSPPSPEGTFIVEFCRKDILKRMWFDVQYY